MGVSRTRARDFNKLILLVRMKTIGWGFRRLSMVGRATLVDFVLLAIPTFVATHTWVPQFVLEEVERICMRFLWQYDNEHRGYIMWGGARCVGRCEQVDLGSTPRLIGWGLCGPGWLGRLWRRGIAFSVVVLKGSTGAVWLTVLHGGRIPILGGWFGMVRRYLLVYLGRSLGTRLRLISSGKLGCSTSLCVSGPLWFIVFLQVLRWGSSLVRIAAGTGESWQRRWARANFGVDDMCVLSSFFSGLSVAKLTYTSRFSGVDERFRWLWRAALPPKVRFFWWRFLWNAISSLVWLAARGLTTEVACFWGCSEVESLEHMRCGCRKLGEVVGILRG